MKKLALSCAVLFFLAVMIMPAAALALADSPDEALTGGSVYSDISGDWYRQAAEAYGYPEIFLSGEDRFEPSQLITRMEFMRMLHKALGIKINYFAAPDIADYFDDVKNNDIGANELIDLFTAGIITEKGSFSPDSPLERDQMIHYLIKAFDYVTGGDYAIIMMMPEPFADNDEILPQYANDVVKAVLLGLIKGRGGNMLYPGQGATRAEAVTAVHRLMTIAKPYMSNVSFEASAVRTQDGGLKMSLTIFNGGDSPVTIEHSSGQMFDFQLLDQNGEILYTWSADKLFITAITTTEIGPGESAEFSDVLDGAAYQPLSNRAVLMKVTITGTSEDFIINYNGYEAAITG
jgi:hypothetical protein